MPDFFQSLSPAHQRKLASQILKAQGGNRHFETVEEARQYFHQQNSDPHGLCQFYHIKPL